MLTYNKMFKLLESKGIEQVDVVFAGGNDSGSVDNFIIHVYGEEKVMDEDEVNKIHPDLGNVLSGVVYNDYGGFAGDYEVNGKYIFSVKDKTVKKECSESYTEYKEIDEIVLDEDDFEAQDEKTSKSRPSIPDSWKRVPVKDKMKDKDNMWGKKLVVCKTCKKPRILDDFSEKIYCDNECDKVYPASNFDYLGKLSYKFRDEEKWNDIETIESLEELLDKDDEN
jgi:hypothetical protein